MRLLFFLLLSTSLASAQQISLAGKWRFAIDKDDTGIKEKWFTKSFNETIELPGSMAERGKGDDVTLQTKWTGSIYDSSFFFRPSMAKYRSNDNLKIPFWLTPAKYYVGATWYQQDIIIPENWSNKTIRIFIERTHIQTRVWVDANEIGTNNSLSTPHRYELGVLTPGKHTLTIRIDNSIKDMTVGPDSHSVSDHTQGNWNGIIGKIYMEALPTVRFTSLQVFPDVKTKTALVKFAVLNARTLEQDAFIILQATSFNSPSIHMSIPSQNRYILKPKDTAFLEMKLAMGDEMLTWDEFDPAMYRLTATINAGMEADTMKTSFGMRSFTTNGTRFMVNDRPVFLRGTLNNCEFPLTGYPAMDENTWVKIFRVAKEHGLNHMRFHSWCPPEAAFSAADRVGFYLQPEAPTWPNHGTSLGDGRFIDQYIYDETNRMIKAYGNHPSFCMLAAGNEPAGKNQASYLAGFVNYWKAKDNRRVYTGASVAMSWPLVPENQYMVKSGPRGLKWTDAEPENNSDYSSAIKDFSVPYVTHEMGQWCVFPNFDEIKKYTGVYKARNFELFEQSLRDHGMWEQAKDFLMASGKLQVLCYKAEIEKDLRTNGLAGFQLLGLQDFPGQGTALVGTVDAFWDDKSYINARQFSRFCNVTVPLAKMKKFIYNNTETLDADIELFHFGKMDLSNAIISWTIKDIKGIVVASGQFPPQKFTIAAAQPVGKISVPLNKLTIPGQYKLDVGVDKTVFFNDWDFWVYPVQLPAVSDQSIYYCNSLNDSAEAVLQKGGKVFLDASGKVVKGKEVVMYFTPVFWNTSWFKMRPPHVTGILVKDKHPAFTYFPTQSFSNYQWWSIVNKSQVMHLEDFPKGFKPLVQPIDTWFMNRPLALLFEAKVGNGKLVVSSAPLSDTASYAANRQLFYSIKKYMLSDKFNPVDTLDLKVIKDLFISPSRETWDSYTKQNPDELKPQRQ
jgi:hypothetical protein